MQRISGKLAVSQQGTSILIFLIVFAFLVYSLFNGKLHLIRICVLAGILILIANSIRLSLPYADIYISEGKIIIKKITGTTIRPITDYKTIEVPSRFKYTTFYLVFNDDKKVNFYLKPLQQLKKTFRSDPNITETLRTKFEDEKSKYQQ